MEDFMKNVVEQVVDSVSTQTQDVVLETVEETVAETGMADNLALDTLDLLLDTGAAEGIAALFGAPVAVVIGLRFLKKYRARGRGNATS
jgi:hypothetical protein